MRLRWCPDLSFECPPNAAIQHSKCCFWYPKGQLLYLEHILPIVLLTLARSLKCIDQCPMDARLARERLKLFQDISSLTGILPDSYWISDNITKGTRISAGAEATVYVGQQRNRTVVVRQFHHVGFDGPLNSQIAEVRLFPRATWKR